MRKVSDELRKKIEDGSAKFYQEAHIVFANGQEKDLGMRDFYLSGNGFSDGAGTNALALGEAMAKSINMVLVNDKEQLSDYDFYHARITVWCCCQLSASVERMKIGTFTIDIPTAREGEIEITGTDDMYKGDIDYDTSLSFPTTAKQMLLDSSRRCGVPLKKETFANDGFVVQKKPTQCTHRAVWGMIAMLAGGNARIDEDGFLEIISYDLSFFARKGLDGGIFDNGEPRYQTGDWADGGNFLDYSSGGTYDGGGFEELGRYHMFYKSQTPTIDTDDVVITGVQASSGDASGLYGTEGYILTVENQLIAGRVQDGVNAIGRLIVGMRFRPFTVDHTSYPLAEFGDICYVFDRKGNFYQSVVTDINFSFYGYTTIKCAADSVMRNRAEYKPAAAGIIADVEKQTDERFEQVEEDTNQKFDEVGNDIDVINQDIDGINQDIGEVNEKVGTLNVSLQKTNEGLQAEVSRALSAEEKIGSRITMTESSIELEVKRAKGAEETLSSRISMTESNITLEVQRATQAEGTLSSRINMTAESISAEVRRAQGAENDLYSRINITADSISAEVIRATSAEGTLSSRIDVTAENINAKVSKGDVVSEINISHDEIRLGSGRLIIESGNCTLDKWGNITVKGGSIGSFTLTNYGALKGSGIEINSSQLWCNDIVPYNGDTVEIGGRLYVNLDLNVDRNVYFPGVYSNNTTADPNLHITSTGYMNTKGGSSRRWKHDIRSIQDAEIDPHRLYNTRTYEFIYNDDYLFHGDHRRGKKIPGFVIEDLEKDYPIAVDYDENGNLSAWSPSMFIAPMVELHKEHHADIERIKDMLNKIIEKIGGI